MKMAKLIGSAVALSVLSSVPAADAQNANREWRRGAIVAHKKEEKRKDDKKKGTVIGAGIGLLAGALFSGGDPWASLAGAAAGGAVGNVTSGNKKDRDRRDEWRGDRGPGWRNDRRDNRNDNWRNDRRDDRRPDWRPTEGR
ncbi:hypothetical protein [Sphingomonas sp. S-NIH.Pt15_0812]|uniref:hypothetical protein n=1 Tax=Sphingomonas sp. S-NIH.Pt15_0812 TaxID=1920129 RepID=UPI0019CFB152|nr:hypothetical protein [Sphingomonas sp. S-NIH.Pt15_0812]